MNNRQLSEHIGKFDAAFLKITLGFLGIVAFSGSEYLYVHRHSFLL